MKSSTSSQQSLSSHISDSIGADAITDSKFGDFEDPGPFDKDNRDAPAGWFCLFSTKSLAHCVI
jgi:hypothetical protein